MPTHYDAAVNLVALSRYDLAERELQRSLAENPGHAASYSLLGICLSRLKRPREALAAVNEGLRLNPTLAFAHYARACVLAKAHKSTRARKDLEEAIRLDPTRPNQFFMLSAIYCDKRRPRKSLAEAERGLALDPNHSGCASLRALALQRLGRKKDAEAAIAHALMLGPNSDFTHTAQAWRLLQKHDQKGARRHFREALRINPENRWAQSGLKSASPAWGGNAVAILLGLVFASRVAAPLFTLEDVGLKLVIVGAGLVFTLGTAAGILWIRDRFQRAMNSAVPPDDNGGRSSMQIPRSRVVWMALIALVAVCGLGSRKYAVYLPYFIAAYAGDTAWTLAVFLGLGLFFPRLSTWSVTALSLVISFTVEFSQLYHAPWIDAIRGTTMGHLALGSGFDPKDLACYTVGASIGVLLEALRKRRTQVERAAP
jgi:tetratricopeptide (TPR) repeat protein